MHPQKHQESNDLRTLLARLDKADAEAHADIADLNAGIERRAEYRREIKRRLGEYDEPALSPAARKAARRWGVGGTIVGGVITWVGTRARNHTTTVAIVTVGATAAAAAVLAPSITDTGAPSRDAMPQATGAPPAPERSMAPPTPTPKPTRRPAAPPEPSHNPTLPPTAAPTAAVDDHERPKKPTPPRPARPPKPEPATTAPIAEEAARPPAGDGHDCGLHVGVGDLNIIEVPCRTH